MNDLGMMAAAVVASVTGGAAFLYGYFAKKRIEEIDRKANEAEAHLAEIDLNVGEMTSFGRAVQESRIILGDQIISVRPDGIIEVEKRKAPQGFGDPVHGKPFDPRASKTMYAGGGAVEPTSKLKPRK